MKKFLLLVAMIATFIGVSAQNPYAYKLSTSDASDASITLHYSLNAPAVAVQLQIFDGETAVATIDVPETMVGKGDHEYIVNFADYPAIPTGKELTWKVQVTGAPVTAPTEVTDNIVKVYSPAGVAVDTDPNSEFFGTIYLTESYLDDDAISAGTYFTLPANNSVGVGLYLFDPQLNGIQNPDGQYGFNFGMQTHTTTVDWRPHRLQLSDDGRLFICNRAKTALPLFEVNRATMEMTPVMMGDINPDNGVVTNGEIEVSSGNCAAFDVKGSGADLKIVLLTGKNGSAVQSDYSVKEYNLGTATTWDQAPSRVITAFDGKPINISAMNLAYDNGDGLWFAQYRFTPSESQPSVLYTSNMTDLTFQYWDKKCRNGGVFFDHATSTAYYGDDDFYLHAKKVTTNEANEVVLEDGLVFNTPNYRGAAQMALDYAGNMVICDNQKENFGIIQMPNVDGDEVVPVVTPAAAKYVFTVPGEQPVEHTYTVAGTPTSIFGTEWDTTNEANDMTLNAETGKYEWTSPEATLNAGDNVEFKVVQDHSWDISYGLEGGDPNVVLTAEKAGKYTLTVYFDPQNNNNVTGELTLIEEIVPEYSEFYAVGYFNDWNQTAEGGRIALDEKEAGVYEATLTLEAGQAGEFKIITFNEDGTTKWFGGADENNLGFFLINSEMLGIDITLTNGANFRPEEAGKYTVQIYEKPATTGLKAISEPLVMKIVKNSSTGIETVGRDIKSDNAWYNLQGVRFENKPVAPGIYIHNGKKVMIK